MDEKVTVQRANVILQIVDDPALIQKYKDKGYNVIDNKTGKVIERAVPHDTGALQMLVVELQKQVKEQEKEIKALNQKIKRLKKEKEQVTE